MQFFQLDGRAPSPPDRTVALSVGDNGAGGSQPRCPPRREGKPFPSPFPTTSPSSTGAERPTRSQAWIKSPGGTQREAPGGLQPPARGRGAAAARSDPGTLSSSPPRAWPSLYLPHTASHPAGRTELFISLPAFPRCASLQRRVLCEQQLINLCSPPCTRGGIRSPPPPVPGGEPKVGLAPRLESHFQTRASELPAGLGGALPARVWDFFLGLSGAGPRAAGSSASRVGSAGLGLSSWVFFCLLTPSAGHGGYKSLRGRGRGREPQRVLGCEEGERGRAGGRRPAP